MNNGVPDILVLEDSDERINWFQQIFEDCNIVYTKNVKTACDELRTNKYDMVFLDRDLGNSKEHGEDVARIMKEEQLAKDALIVVHTVNPRGQRNIEKYLKQYHGNFHIINFAQLRKMKRSDFSF